MEIELGNMHTCRDMHSWSSKLGFALDCCGYRLSLKLFRILAFFNRSSSVQVVMKKQNDTELLVLDLQISGESEISWSHSWSSLVPELVPSIPNHIQQVQQVDRIMKWLALSGAKHMQNHRSVFFGTRKTTHWDSDCDSGGCSNYLFWGRI